MRQHIPLSISALAVAAIISSCSTTLEPPLGVALFSSGFLPYEWVDDDSLTAVFTPTATAFYDMKGTLSVTAMTSFERPTDPMDSVFLVAPGGEIHLDSAIFEQEFAAGDTLQRPFTIRFAPGMDDEMAFHIIFAVEADSIRLPSGKYVAIDSDSARTVLGEEGEIQNRSAFGRFVEVKR